MANQPEHIEEVQMIVMMLTIDTKSKEDKIHIDELAREVQALSTRELPDKRWLYDRVHSVYGVGDRIGWRTDPDCQGPNNRRGKKIKGNFLKMRFKSPHEHLSECPILIQTGTMDESRVSRGIFSKLVEVDVDACRTIIRNVSVGYAPSIRCGIALLVPEEPNMGFACAAVGAWLNHPLFASVRDLIKAGGGASSVFPLGMANDGAGVPLRTYQKCEDLLNPEHRLTSDDARWVFPISDRLPNQRAISWLEDMERDFDNRLWDPVRSERFSVHRSAMVSGNYFKPQSAGLVLGGVADWETHPIVDIIKAKMSAGALTFTTLALTTDNLQQGPLRFLEGEQREIGNRRYQIDLKSLLVYLSRRE